jgi:hypothetical protein
VPFDGDSAGEIMLQHLEAEPVPPSAVAGDLPAWADALVLRLLQKDPAQRYDSVRGFLEELERITAHSGEDLSVSEPSRDLMDAPPLELAGEGATEAASEGEGAEPVPPIEPGSKKDRGPKELSERAEPQGPGAAPAETALPVHGYELSAVARRAPAALIFLVVMGALAALPVGMIAKGLWESLAERAAAAPEWFFISALPVLGLYALIGAVPLASLVMLYQPFMRSILLGLQMALYLFGVAGLVVMLQCSSMHSLVRDQSRPGKGAGLLDGADDAMRAGVTNLVEVSLLVPRGTFYNPTVSKRRAILMDGIDRADGAAIYYGLLAAYLAGMALFAGRGLELSWARSLMLGAALVFSVWGACALERLLHTPITSVSGWRVMGVLKYRGGPFEMIFDRYSLGCGLLNWFLVACVLIYFGSMLPRRAEQYYLPLRQPVKRGR